MDCRDSGRLLGVYSLCLEAQHKLDSSHHEACMNWPSTVRRPGEVWRSTTIHRFS